jgi:hypothetical protein
MLTATARSELSDARDHHRTVFGKDKGFCGREFQAHKVVAVCDHLSLLL